jgi:hypothetical protein
MFGFAMGNLLMRDCIVRVSVEKSGVSMHMQPWMMSGLSGIFGSSDRIGWGEFVF